MLAITCGLVAAAAKAPEGDAVFRISEDDDGAAFEHDQGETNSTAIFWNPKLIVNHVSKPFHHTYAVLDGP